MDITEIFDTYQDGQITLTLETADPVDPTAAANAYLVNWGIWVNGNSDPTTLDYVAEFANAGQGDEATAVLDAQSAVEPCTPVVSFTNGQFSMTFPASCIGSPTSIEVAAFMITLTPTVPDDVPFDVAPDDGTACCGATDTESTTTTSSTTTSSTTSTTSTTSSTTTSTTPTSSTTTTMTAPSSSTTTSTTLPPTASTTTTTTPVALASANGGSAGGPGGTSGGAPSGSASIASGPLAFTGVNAAVLRWLLLCAGLLMLGGSLGRRWVAPRLVSNKEASGVEDDGGRRQRGRAAKKWSLSRSRSFLLVLIAVAGATVAVAGSGRATPDGHGAPAASFARAFPASTVLGPRLFGGSGHAAQTQPVVPPGSDRPTAEPVASANWSGYVVTAAESSPITDAQGSWTLPNVALSWAPTSSAAWVGIGGGVSGDTTLAQVGTEQDSFYGLTSFSAWWSTASQGYLAIPVTQDDKGEPFNVSPGDDMSAEVHQSSAGQVSFTLVDNTTDQTTNTLTDYQGTGLTAEWILEAPSEVDQSGHFTVLTLADYGSTVFDGLTINGEVGSVDLTSNDVVLMEQNNAVISYPSAPSSSGDAFAVAYGSTQPSPPTGATTIVAGPEARGGQRKMPVAAPDERSILDGNFDSP